MEKKIKYWYNFDTSEMVSRINRVLFHTNCGVLDEVKEQGKQDELASLLAGYKQVKQLNRPKEEVRIPCKMIFQFLFTLMDNSKNDFSDLACLLRHYDYKAPEKPIIKKTVPHWEKKN